MKNTSAKVGESVRIYTTIPNNLRKGRNKFVHYDGVIHEISYLVNNNPYHKLFKNGYVMLVGKFILHLNGRWIHSTKRKISLDRIQRITKRVNHVA